MHRSLAFAAFVATIAACSSFGSESPGTVGDAGTTTNLDGGGDGADAAARPIPSEAGTKAALVQANARQDPTDGLLGPVKITFKSATTPGNGVIVVVGNAGPSASKVNLDGAALKQVGISSTHIALTVWVGAVASPVGAVDVSWNEPTKVHNPTVFITEWSNLAELSKEEDDSGDPGEEVKSPTLPGDNAYSLVLAIGATQDKPGDPTNSNFMSVEGSGVGGLSLFLSLAYTTTPLESYSTSWPTNKLSGWDSLTLAFK